LGAAAGFSFATIDAAQSPQVLPFLASRAQQRQAQGFACALQLVQRPDLSPQDAWFEARNLVAQMLRREQAALESFAAFTRSEPPQLASGIESLRSQAAAFDGWIDQIGAQRGVHDSWVPAWHRGREAARIPRRIGEFGPLTFQNDNVLADRLGEERLRRIKLLDADSSRLLNAQDSGAIYAYEIVNLVDGKRSVAEIRDAVAAELGPIPVEVVSDYLQACEEAKIIAFR
jgi:hypothetical protein